MRNLLSCALLTRMACVTGACVAPSGDPQGIPELAESAQTGAIKGTYSVPVGDASLQAVATFSVSVKVQALGDGNVRLHYTLPAELVGTPQDVDLTGPPGGVLRGAAGTGQCVPASTGDTTCEEHLPGMLVNVDTVSTVLASQQLSLDEQSARLRVAKQFAIDPIGVLRFSRAGSGSGKHGGGA